MEAPRSRHQVALCYCDNAMTNSPCTLLPLGFVLVVPLDELVTPVAHAWSAFQQLCSVSYSFPLSLVYGSGCPLNSHHGTSEWTESGAQVRAWVFLALSEAPDTAQAQTEHHTAEDVTFLLNYMPPR